METRDVVKSIVEDYSLAHLLEAVEGVCRQEAERLFEIEENKNLAQVWWIASARVGFTSRFAKFNGL
jgi:hypothetical protein